MMDNNSIPRENVDGSGIAEPYQLIRPADCFQTMFKLHQELGVFSNMIVCAAYIRADKKLFTPAMLYEALAQVTSQHASLSMTLKSQPSLKNKGNKRTWEARLKEIDLTGCVRFVHEDDDEKGLTQLFEQEHNNWFDHESTKPLWRVVVVNHVHVLFIVHHAVADGLSGVLFHRSLLSSLNNISKREAGEKSSSAATYTLVTIPESAPGRRLVSILTSKGMKTSILGILWVYGLAFFIRLFYGGTSGLFSDAILSDGIPSTAESPSTSTKTITRIERMVIDTQDMEKCLVACKKHNTSFTALLHTLVQITLVADLYPDAKVGVSSIPVAFQNLMPGEFNEEFGSFSSNIKFSQWLTKYSRASSQFLSSNNGAHLNLTWDLARKFKAAIKKGTVDHKTPTAAERALSVTLLGEDEEQIASRLYPGMATSERKSFIVSSLGAIEEVSESRGPWKFGDLEFSVAAQKAVVAWILYFAIVSLKGGRCVINASYQEGVLKPERVRMILEGVEKRLKTLLEVEEQHDRKGL